MTTAVFQTPRGMHDALGVTFRRKASLLKIFHQTAHLFGCQGVETPLVEERGLFERSVALSDIVMKEMFQLETRREKEPASQNTKHYVLRPEGTAPLMRAMLQNGLTQSLPLRWCYDGPMFRYDRPQKGRLRQFHQVGIELLGSDSFLMDVEAIQCAAHFLKKLNLSEQPTLFINSLGDVESRTAYKAALQAFLKPYEKELSPESQARLHTNPLRILDSKSTTDQALLKEAPLVADFFTKEARAFFANVCQTLQDVGIAFKHDPKLVRGLDYYTQTAFEFKVASLGAQDTVLGGGRFDGLSQLLGGPAIPGVGWAAGVERLLLLMPQEDVRASLVAFLPLAPEDVSEGLKQAALLRAQGVPLLWLSQPAALPKRLKKAHQQGITFVLIFGGQERAEGCIQLKDLESATQQKLPLDALASHLKTLL